MEELEIWKVNLFKQREVVQVQDDQLWDELVEEFFREGEDAMVDNHLDNLLEFMMMEDDPTSNIEPEVLRLAFNCDREVLIHVCL